ncbi:MAG: hypothetical protein M1829_006915 [Trizodia sp. TS-e1964]|nr:MAG: hypothetical protein M1829_006915 [Trizodia sp. TS-e1964]
MGATTISATLDGKLGNLLLWGRFLREYSHLLKVPEAQEGPPKKRARISSAIDHAIDGYLNVLWINIDLALSAEASLPAAGEKPIDWTNARSYDFPLLIPQQQRDGRFRIGFSRKPIPLSCPVMFFKSASLSSVAPTLLCLDRTVSSRVLRNECSLLVPAGDTITAVRIQTKAFWKVVNSPNELSFGIQKPYELNKLLGFCFPKNRPTFVHEEQSPQDFYDAAHSTDPDEDIPLALTKLSEQLNCTLFPFQTRAVRWMLRREGVDFNSSDKLSLYAPEIHSGPPFSFQRETDLTGRECFVSHLLLTVATDLSQFQGLNEKLHGGILAEEMGLGKTVELISLISLHRRQLSLSKPMELFSSNKELRCSGATLIITPKVIESQWMEEIENHAPKLKVLNYEGPRKGVAKNLSHAALIQKLAEQDVVVTTHQTLAREIHYALPNTTCTLRQERKHKRPTSPLVDISWWRVCLDEAQMLGDGVGNAAKVAQMIQRCNAWAVSGTPVRKDIGDLHGLLVFLQLQPFCDSYLLWKNFNIGFRTYFKEYFKQISLRHAKPSLRNEIRLPPQKRIVITVPFSKIEAQNYDQTFERMCEDCGLNNEGGPLELFWDPNSQQVIKKMRRWLNRLRQICLHPEIGWGVARALKQGILNQLSTVDEVLNSMIEENSANIHAEERALFRSRLELAKFHEIQNNLGAALEIFKEVLADTLPFVKDSREQLARAIKESESPGLKPGPKDLTDDQTDGDDTDGDEAEAEIIDSKASSRIGACQKRLRSALELLHVCYFFLGNIYFNLRETSSKESQHFEALEYQHYENAKKIRKEILSEYSSQASKIINKIRNNRDMHSFVQVPEVPRINIDPGTQTKKLAQRLEDIRAILNDQAKLITEWRGLAVELLVRPLVDEETGDAPEGNEFEESKMQQEKVYVYCAALRTLVTDRSDALSGLTNILIERQVKFARAQAMDGNGHDPTLTLNLLNVRDSLKLDARLGSLRSLQSDLRSLGLSMNQQNMDKRRQDAVALGLMHSVVDHSLKEQSQAVTYLEKKELEMFTKAMNSRLEYYRQLQRISDTVVAYGEHDEKHLSIPPETAIRNMEVDRGKYVEKIAALKSKRRYLMHLQMESGNPNAQHSCIICQSTFETGALTVCGHQYCKECIQLWWAQHHSCPLCKLRLNKADLHHVSYKTEDLLIEEEAVNQAPNSGVGNTASRSIYAGISKTDLNQIKNVDIGGSHGTKIDTLVRHIIWLRERYQGAKAIMFSQNNDFLGILGKALSGADIGFTSIKENKGIEKFKNNANVVCFLLHARAHSSGLNLVNATHVFLCEPLLNTAIELQAIARVHRIGQNKPTTVWMYLIGGTVEEAIYRLSVKRRMAHIKSESMQLVEEDSHELEETAFDFANSHELEKAVQDDLFEKGADQGELVEQDDLWPCLFGGKRMANLELDGQ